MRDVASSVLSDGAEVVARVAAVVDLEATARASGALRRVRKVRQASEGGCRFDLLAHLPPADAPVQHLVRLRGQPVRPRLGSSRDCRRRRRRRPVGA